MIFTEETLGVATRCAAGAQLYKAGPWARDLYLLLFLLCNRVPPPLFCSQRISSVAMIKSAMHRDLACEPRPCSV
jgi:hypothetical protein